MPEKTSTGHYQVHCYAINMVSRHHCRAGLGFGGARWPPALAMTMPNNIRQSHSVRLFSDMRAEMQFYFPCWIYQLLIPFLHDSLHLRSRAPSHHLGCWIQRYLIQRATLHLVCAPSRDNVKLKLTLSAPANHCLPLVQVCLPGRNA